MDQPNARLPALDRRPTPGAASPTASADPPRRWSSDALLAGAREVEITHGNALYRLRLTALGKLILTK